MTVSAYILIQTEVGKAAAVAEEVRGIPGVIAAIIGFIMVVVGVIALGGSVIGLISYLCAPQQASAIGTAIFGGSGGTAFVDNVSRVRRIARIEIRHGGYVDALQLTWEMEDGSRVQGPWRGGGGGNLTQLELDPGETIVKITGRSGAYVDQLTFYTNKGRMLGPYGGSGGPSLRTSRRRCRVASTTSAA